MWWNVFSCHHVGELTKIHGLQQNPETPEGQGWDEATPCESESNGLKFWFLTGSAEGFPGNAVVAGMDAQHLAKAKCDTGLTAPRVDPLTQCVPVLIED